MVGVSVWMTSVAIPVSVSLATTILFGLTVGPRLAARSKRIQDAHDDRDRFGKSVLELLALCGNLEKVTVPPEAQDPARSRLRGERDRWVSQIDETTAWLADNWQQVALGYAGTLGIRDLVVRYMGAARGL
jgi:hypothetical protein